MSNGNDIQGDKPLYNPSRASGRGADLHRSASSSRNTPLPQLKPIARCKMSTTTFIANGIPKQILGANPNRNYLLIQNNGLNTIFIGFGDTPNLNGFNALQIPGGDNAGISFESGVVPNNNVLIVATSETLVTVIEGVSA
jgi:hypothetical protein